MRLAVVYYSKTGNTLKVVETLRRALADMNTLVDVYKVLPIDDYGKPLHINPRVLYDIFIRKGTDISIEPKVFDVDKYERLVVASPIWFNTLAPPIQEFLKKYRLEGKHIVIIVTSALPISCSRIEKFFEEIKSGKPKLCINITVNIIKDEQKLAQYIYSIAKRILELD